MTNSLTTALDSPEGAVVSEMVVALTAQQHADRLAKRPLTPLRTDERRILAVTDSILASWREYGDGREAVHDPAVALWTALANARLSQAWKHDSTYVQIQRARVLKIGLALLVEITGLPENVLRSIRARPLDTLPDLAIQALQLRNRHPRW